MIRLKFNLNFIYKILKNIIEQFTFFIEMHDPHLQLQFATVEITSNNANGYATTVQTTSKDTNVLLMPLPAVAAAAATALKTIAPQVIATMIPSLIHAIRSKPITAPAAIMPPPKSEATELTQRPMKTTEPLELETSRLHINNDTQLDPVISTLNDILQEVSSNPQLTMLNNSITTIAAQEAAPNVAKIIENPNQKNSKAKQIANLLVNKLINAFTNRLQSTSENRNNQVPDLSDKTLKGLKELSQLGPTLEEIHLSNGLFDNSSATFSQNGFNLRLKTNSLGGTSFKLTKSSTTPRSPGH